METVSITINAERREQVTERLEQFARRAVKLGFATPYWTFGPVTIADATDKDARRFECELSLSFEPIKLAGWTFVATLDHATESGNIVSVLPGQSLPEHYHHCSPACQHCNTSRRRNETYVIRNESTGEYRQIGRNCMADFIGVDPRNAIAYCGHCLTIESELDAMESTGSGRTMLGTKRYLEYVAATIRLAGWMSRTTAKDMQRTSTADMAANVYWRPHQSPEVQITDADTAAAESAIEWALTLADKEPLSQYEHNLLVIARNVVIPYKAIGFAASMIVAHNKAMARNAERTAQPVSQHVGTIGAKVSTAATLAFVHSFDTAYGVKTIYKFCDAAGNELVWFTSSDVDAGIGDTVQLTGTVSEHGAYNSTKQTVLKRCKVKRTAAAK